MEVLLTKHLQILYSPKISSRNEIIEDEQILMQNQLAGHLTDGIKSFNEFDKPAVVSLSNALASIYTSSSVWLEHGGRVIEL